MKRVISIAAAGLFHYKHYVKHLDNSGSLKCIYFSHKTSSLSEIPKVRRTNIFIKEYLMYAHMRLFGARSAFANMAIYNRIWDKVSSVIYIPTKLNLVLLQGNCMGIMSKIKAHQGILIGEAVNIHPASMHKLLSDDARLHGGRFFWSNSVLKSKVAEIDLLDYILAPSKTVANSYIDNGFPPEKIITIPYGSSDRITPQEIENVPRDTDLLGRIQKVKLLCVAQVFPRKGQYHLLKAIEAEGTSIDLEITFVGIADPEYLKAMRAVGVSFVHTPSLPHAEVISRMRMADVVVLNSLEDGFGMVVTEALSVGTPIAVSKFAGAAELVSSIGGGVTYDPLNYAGTIKAITDCASGYFPRRTARIPTWQDYAAALEESLFEIAESIGK